jgi:hypothetical protein
MVVSFGKSNVNVDIFLILEEMFYVLIITVHVRNVEGEIELRDGAI